MFRSSIQSRVRRGLAGAIALFAVFSFSLSGDAAGVVSITPAGAQSFTIYTPPDGTPGKHTADEPSIGANWNSGAIMYLALLTTLRVNFDDTQSPPAATWTDVSAPLTSIDSFDPILFTDSVTGRTIVSQLSPAEGECSLSELTDNDGAAWTPDVGCGPPSGIDHQTVGGGPFALIPPPPAPTYPHAVYYCSQLVASAFCNLSVDGGVTYLASVPIYTAAQCGGLHGHIRVAPNGTAIVPNQNCTGAADPINALGLFPNQGAVVSTNNGTSWGVNVIPDSTATLRSDPSTAADAANKWYFGYENSVNDGGGNQIAGRATVSTSANNGATWSPSVDVGAPLGIQNVTFPEVMTGDSGRAAYAFLGSTTAGNPEDTGFPGFWYLYIAMTYDGGQNWSVSNLTPNDPVERGCIYLAGNGTCPSTKRNLLDFMDITADNHGRVLVGYADGCTTTCVTQQGQPCSDANCATGPTASTDRQVAIARETCGEGLNAQFDASLSCAAVNAAVTPDVPWVPAIVFAGVAVAGVGWSRRRNRRLIV